MISEDEAFWAGIAVAVMMLGGGFSMLFLSTFTGFGAVVLALGLMTMALTIQARAKPIDEYVAQAMYGSSMLPSPSAPIEAAKETVAPQPSNEPVHTEPAEQSPPPNPEPNPPLDQPTPEPVQPPQPVQPQAPVEDTTQPPKPEEKPKEEPQVVAAAAN